MYADRIKAALQILRGKAVIYGVKIRSVSTIHISPAMLNIESEDVVYLANNDFKLLNRPVERNYTVALD
jgi:hypothetical protein